MPGDLASLLGKVVSIEHLTVLHSNVFHCAAVKVPGFSSDVVMLSCDLMFELYA